MEKLLQQTTIFPDADEIEIPKSYASSIDDDDDDDDWDDDDDDDD